MGDKQLQASVIPHSGEFLRLRALTGCPVRVSILSESGVPLTLSGVLERVVVTGMLVSVPEEGHFWKGQKVRLEVHSREALVQSNSTVTHVDPGGRLSLDIPQSVAEVQRRRHPRIHVQLDSVLEVANVSEPVQVQVINLSMGGAACASPLHVEPGTSSLLHLNFSRLSPAELPAVVVRSTPIDGDLWLLGLAFQSPNPAQEAKVSQYISSVVQG